MLELSTSDSRFVFKVDGKEYGLDPIGLDDFELVDEAMSGGETGSLIKIRELIYSKADEATRGVLRKLSAPQFQQVSKGWLGVSKSVTPGESGGSAE